MSEAIHRRRFMKRAAVASVALGAGLTDSSLKNAAAQSKSKTDTQAAVAPVRSPSVHTADKTGQQHFVGQGDYRYEVSHSFFKLPDKFHWQTTQNVAVDGSGRVYVIHQGCKGKPVGPTIFVFDALGKFIKAFGEKYHGGGHGLEVRREGKDEFIYVTTVIGHRVFAKLTLDGEQVWERRSPMAAKCCHDDGKNIYEESDDKKSKCEWGKRNTFKPTNIAFGNDGEFFVADGYGAWVVHRFDKDANYLSTFGKRGRHEGQFRMPHGIWFDQRQDQPRIVVADRQNNRLQWFSPDGKHLKSMGGFLLPANCDTQGELLLVPEMEARITLLGPDDKVVARLGDDADYRKKLWAKDMQMRKNPELWQDGRFVHPHDACFDADGNIIVAEWVDTGRISKLTRLG